MLIIGLCGPYGSGKDVSAEYLAEKLGIKHVSGGDVLRSMLRSLDLTYGKDELRTFAIFIRENYGAEAIYNRVKAESHDAPGIIWSGFRSPSEASLVKESGGLIIYVDAPSNLRYERINSRKRKYDDLSRTEQIDKNEVKDNHEKGENLVKVQEIADLVIKNDSTLEDLYLRLDEAIKIIKKKLAL